MVANPYESPENPSDIPQQPSAWSRFVLPLFMVAGIVGLLVALLMPATRAVPEAGRRMQCNNHLKQIALGLQNYADTFGCLPPSYTVDASGKPLHSWRTLILPFVEQKPLYDQIDLSKRWDDPANEAARNAKSSASAARAPRLVFLRTAALWSSSNLILASWISFSSQSSV